MIQRLYRTKAARLSLPLISVLFVAGVLALLLYRNRHLLADLSWQLNWLAFASAFGLGLACMVWPALIWGRIMAVFGSQATLPQHIRCYMLSQLVKRLPGTVWYVASRAQLYQEYGESARLVTMASGVEFVLIFVSGIFATLLLAPFALPNTDQIIQNILVITFFVGIFLVQPRTIRWLLRKFKLSDEVNLRYTMITGWLIAYLLLWLTGGLMYFCLLNTFVPLTGNQLLYVIASWCLVGTLAFFVFFCPRIWALTKSGLVYSYPC